MSDSNNPAAALLADDDPLSTTQPLILEADAQPESHYPSLPNLPNLAPSTPVDPMALLTNNPMAPQDADPVSAAQPPLAAAATAEHYSHPSPQVVVFDNVGGDGGVPMPPLPQPSLVANPIDDNNNSNNNNNSAMNTLTAAAASIKPTTPTLASSTASTSISIAIDNTAPNNPILTSSPIPAMSNLALPPQAQAHAAAATATSIMSTPLHGSGGAHHPTPQSLSSHPAVVAAHSHGGGATAGVAHAHFGDNSSVHHAPSSAAPSGPAHAFANAGLQTPQPTAGSLHATPSSSSSAHNHNHNNNINNANNTSLTTTTPQQLGKVVESGHEHTGRWTKEEHESFLSALQLYGKEWKKVAARVKTRTVVQTRTHAQKYFQKLQKVLEGGGGGGGGVGVGGGGSIGSLGGGGGLLSGVERDLMNGELGGSVGSNSTGSPALTSASIAAMMDLGMTPISEKKVKGKRGGGGGGGSRLVGAHHHQHQHHPPPQPQQLQQHPHISQQQQQQQQVSHHHHHHHPQIQHVQHMQQHPHLHADSQPQMQQQQQQQPSQLSIVAPQSTLVHSSSPSPSMPRTPSAMAAANLMANMSTDRRHSLVGTTTPAGGGGVMGGSVIAGPSTAGATTTSVSQHGFTASTIGTASAVNVDSSAASSTAAAAATSAHGFGYIGAPAAAAASTNTNTNTMPSTGPATNAANVAANAAPIISNTTSGISIMAPPTHEDMMQLGKFPEPSPAACGKRKMAEIAAAQMLAGVVGSVGAASALGGAATASSLNADSAAEGAMVAVAPVNKGPSVGTAATGSASSVIAAAAAASAAASLTETTILPPMDAVDSTFFTAEDGTATPPPNPSPLADSSSGDAPMNAIPGQQIFGGGRGLSLQIVNPDSLGNQEDGGVGGSKRRLINGQASPSTPWDGQLEALVSHVKSQEAALQDIITLNNSEILDESFANESLAMTDQEISIGTTPVANTNLLLPFPLRSPRTAIQTAILSGSITEVSQICSNPLGSNTSMAVNERNDGGYLPLHSSSALGLLDSFGPNCEEAMGICRLLIENGADVTCRDRGGNTPVHWAARAGHGGVLGLLLSKNCPIDAQNDTGETALHWAMRAGTRGVDVVQVLVENGARVNVFNRGFKRPLDIAAEGFGSLDESSENEGETPNNNDSSQTVDSRERRSTRWNLLKHSSQCRTLVLHHQECLDHVAKSAHDWEVPDRIQSIMSTLTNRTTEACDADDDSNFKPYEVTVSNDFERATLELLSRIHSAEYLAFVNDLSKELERRRKQQLIEDTQSDSSANVPEKPLHVVPFTPMVQRKIMKEAKAKEDGHSDTSFSAGSLKAARRAAGAVQHAVDCVLVGRNRNAFCVVRPPGHHAGINGLLSDAESCGFCLFNNVAAGAMHALSDEKHRPRCERCAIVDIDAHHGNGTEEIVRKCHDSGRLLFFSVHIFDHDKPKKGVDFQYKFYPGTGAEDDVAHNVINVPIAPLWREKEVVKSISSASNGSSNATEPRQTRRKSKQAAAAAEAEAASTVVSPPDINKVLIDDPTLAATSKQSSSASLGSESAASDIIQPSKPRPQLPSSSPHYPPHYLMGVGRLAYRRAIQHRLLPALRAFNPDLIIMSTGFDAARGDVGNARHFVGGTEAMGLDLEPEDYAWTARKVCEVADICCHGRVVSVLEGGYGRTPPTVPMPPISEGSAPEEAFRPALDKSFFSECAMHHLKGLMDPYAENDYSNSSKRKRS